MPRGGVVSTKFYVIVSIWVAVIAAAIIIAGYGG
jgi:hypothetical protein